MTFQHIFSPYFANLPSLIFAKTSGYYLKSFVIRDFDLWFPVFIELPRHFLKKFCITPQRQTETCILFSSLSLPCRFRTPSLPSDRQSAAPRASLSCWLEGTFPLWGLLFGTSVSCYSSIWRDHVVRWQEAGKICCNKNALKKKKDTCFYLLLRRAWLKAGSEVTIGSAMEGQRGRQVWLS